MTRQTARLNGIEQCLKLSEQGVALFADSRESYGLDVHKIQTVLEILNQNNIPYTIIGAVAMAQYVEARFTQDFDVMVSAQDAGRVIRLFKKNYIRGASNVLFFEFEGTRVDVLTARLRFELDALANAEKITVSGTPARVLKIRDLLLFKLRAMPERPVPEKQKTDQADIISLLRLHGAKLNREDIAYCVLRLRDLCVLPEELARWKESITFLNKTLERLQLNHLCYEVASRQ